jgi:hypothetical protein
MLAMVLSSHADDGAAGVTWPGRDAYLKLYWRWRW